MDKNKASKKDTHSPTDRLEALARNFNGHGFYGLEYVVDDLFQNDKKDPKNSNQAPVDWFGLYD